MTYLPDFVGDDFIIECKGLITDSFPLRWKIFKYILMQQNSKYRLYLVRNQKQVDELVNMLRDEKHTKKEIEESVVMWKLEKSSMPTDKKRYENLIKVVEPLILSGTILYSDFIEKLIEEFEKIQEDHKVDIEERKKQIDNVFQNVTDYFTKFNKED